MDCQDGAIMARWRPFTYRYLTYFDGCGFGKCWLISLRLALLVPLKPSHNLLVRGSNPCGGTNQPASCRDTRSDILKAPSSWALMSFAVICGGFLTWLVGLASDPERPLNRVS